MSTSNRFDAYLRAVRKKRHELEESDILSRIEEAFSSCMTDFPEAMVIDLHGHFMGDVDIAIRSADSDRENDYTRIDAIIAGAEKLQRIVELFDENYEIADDDLTDGEWEVIKQCVDDFALELDTQLITYIMRFIVKRGLIT